MSQTSLPFGLTGPILARSTATAFGLLGATTGVRALLQPTAFAETFGFSQNQGSSKDRLTATSQNSNPFIPALGARNIASGITLLFFAYEKNDVALGVCLISGLITGVADGLLILNHPSGLKDAAIGHFIATAIFTSVGVYLYSSS